jgi:CheY-like chemotaxis protein
MASTIAMLEDLGHIVVQATSAIAALTLLRSDNGVDLVLTDHAMPGLTGTELARLIRQTWPRLPVILVTGYPELPRGEDQGYPWLTKPYTREDLSARIDALLGEPDNVVAVEFPRRA